MGTENERLLAGELGPEYQWLPDNEAIDHFRKDRRGVEHGSEIKTLLTNKRGKTHMHPKQQKRKEAWVRGLLRGIKDPRERPDPSYNAAKGRILHAIAIDHREAYYDSVYGGVDFSKRKFDQLYYARGAKPWDIKNMIGVTSGRILDRLQKLSPNRYAAVYKKFAGRMYPSGKPHPVVTKVVGGETLAQVQHLYTERTREYDKAVALLQRRQQKAAELKKQLTSALAAVAGARGREQRTAAKHAVAKITTNLVAIGQKINTSRTKVDVRKKKLDLTTARLELKKAEDRKRNRHERVH